MNQHNTHRPSNRASTQTTLAPYLHQPAKKGLHPTSLHSGVVIHPRCLPPNPSEDRPNYDDNHEED